MIKVDKTPAKYATTKESILTEEAEDSTEQYQRLPKAKTNNAKVQYLLIADRINMKTTTRN